MTTNKDKYKKRMQKAKLRKAVKKTNELIATDSLKRPDSFSSLSDVVAFSKKAVYSLTRMRQIEGVTYTGTIGTGFLAAPNRLVTCSHVIKSTQSNSDFAHHKDGDTYFLLSKDEEGKEHWHRFRPKLNVDLHLYPGIDLAIMELSDEFYYRRSKVLQNKNLYIPLCKDKNPLATDVSVIGYPLEKDGKGKDKGVYIDQTTQEIKKENIRMRTDKGVVNASYKDLEDNEVAKYEFTMAFNPGNSGGPIINIDGCVVAIVHGYKAFPIKIIEERFTRKKKDGTEEKIAVPATIRATYSIGISSENFIEIASKHQLITC